MHMGKPEMFLLLAVVFSRHSHDYTANEGFVSIFFNSLSRLMDQLIRKANSTIPLFTNGGPRGPIKTGQSHMN